MDIKQKELITSFLWFLYLKFCEDADLVEFEIKTQDETVYIGTSIFVTDGIFAEESEDFLKILLKKDVNGEAKEKVILIDDFLSFDYWHWR